MQRIVWVMAQAVFPEKWQVLCNLHHFCHTESLVLKRLLFSLWLLIHSIQQVYLSVLRLGASPGPWVVLAMTHIYRSFSAYLWSVKDVWLLFLLLEVGYHHKFMVPTSFNFHSLWQIKNFNFRKQWYSSKQKVRKYDWTIIPQM